MPTQSLSIEFNDSEAQFLNYVQSVNDICRDWPFISSVVKLENANLSWQMEYYERLSLIAVLQNFRPSVSIEIGTYSGGSLSVLSQYSQRVLSLDKNPLSSKYLAGHFSNVTYVVGDSKLELPRVLQQVERDQDGRTFVLVDGDHSQSGVLADINNVLQFNPRYPTIIMMHDSFNPECRAGMLRARWSENPYVHLVEIDFQHGSLFNRSNPLRQMWGGLALAILLPEKRMDMLTVSRRHDLLYQTVLAESCHKTPSWISKRLIRLGRTVRHLPVALNIRSPQ